MSKSKKTIDELLEEQSKKPIKCRLEDADCGMGSCCEIQFAPKKNLGGRKMVQLVCGRCGLAELVDESHPQFADVPKMRKPLGPVERKKLAQESAPVPPGTETMDVKPGDLDEERA